MRRGIKSFNTEDVLTTDLGATPNFYIGNPTGAGVAGIVAMESNTGVKTEGDGVQGADRGTPLGAVATPK